MAKSKKEDPKPETIEEKINRQRQLTQGQGDPNAPTEEERQREQRAFTGTILPKDEAYNPNIEPPKSSRRDNIVLVILSAIISVAVVMIGVPRMAPSVNAYRSDITRLELDLVDIREDYALSADIPDFTEVTDKVTANEVRLTDNEASINSLNSRISNAESNINTLLAQDLSLPLEYSLSGTFGNVNLAALSQTTGDFIALITIEYLVPYAVTGTNLSEAMTSFYNELVAPNRNYFPELVWSSGWKVARVSFYTGKFALTGGSSSTLPIAFTGLKSGVGFENVVYAEVFPAMGESSGDGEGI